MKKLLRNINLLNILLIVAILIFINYTVLPLFNGSVSYKLPNGKKPPVYKDEKTAEIAIPSLTDYTMIAEDNLFHPERKIPLDIGADQALEKPEFLLYGTLITDDVRLAYLEDKKAPQNTAGRGKRQTTLKLGNVMSGYTLKEIYPDKVIMVRGEEILAVLMNDSAKPRSEGVATPQQASARTTRQTPASPAIPAFEQPSAPHAGSQVTTPSTVPSTTPATARGKGRRGPRNSDSMGGRNSQRR